MKIEEKIASRGNSRSILMLMALLVANVLFLLINSPASAHIGTLLKDINGIIDGKKAEVGVAVCEIEDGETLNIRGTERFPMQSVFKFPIALAVLHEVDNGKFSLNQNISIRQQDLLPDTWSPLRDKYPNGGILNLSEILRYTVSESDNNGCDILLRLLGGVKTANDYIHKNGISGIAIQANEEEMHKDWNVQFSNWITPKAAAKLLVDFYNQKFLSKECYNFLWTIMAETPTGRNRIRGELPSATIVAHKTGGSGTNKQGITAATNDMGIVVLPNGKHYAIAIFVSNSAESDETNEKIISSISKVIWDYFVRK
ncbi:CepA family class A extended-spectrum beta-lactamase [Synergistales bacterium]|nr:CepA family class A extended-spectrum beta-lactamase [Synergistales bacterium]